jgi:hypothetical protein
LRFNVALDNSLPQMYGARRMASRPLAVFTGIDQDVLFSGGAQALVLGYIDFLNPAFSLVHQRQKARVVMFGCGHVSSL